MTLTPELRQVIREARDRAARERVRRERIVDLEMQNMSRSTIPWPVIVHRYEQGESMRKLAREFDTSTSTVSRGLRHRGIQLRETAWRRVGSPTAQAPILIDDRRPSGEPRREQQ